ncbi:MAG: hypothetical protein B7Y39_11775 [Bdellovibrio sp. 28-41-41]|nr:MAG: hypothetical protein B7Y39_11775 [Bdellovibrio sp. 28-41-41]
MYAIKSLLNSRGFSLLSILISIAILSILSLVITAFVSDFYKQTSKVETKIKAIGISSELRAAIELTSTCSLSIKKDTFGYPGLQGDGTIILNTPDAGLPLSFNLDSGVVAGDSTQSSTIKVNSLKMYAASLVSSYNNLRLYSGRLILTAFSDTNDANASLLPPLLIGMINLTVDIATNKIVGCSDSISAYSLCASMGGKFDPTAVPICNFLELCPSGQTLIYNTTGLPVCKKIVDDLSKICPPSTYFKTTSIGVDTNGDPVTDVLCQGSMPPIERVFVKPIVSCTGGRNSTCSVNFNYRSLLSAADQAKLVKKIKIGYYAFTNSGSPGCRIKYTSVFNTEAAASNTYGYCGSSCALTTSTIDSLGNASISATTGGFAKNCKANACEPCVSDVSVELEF